MSDDVASGLFSVVDDVTLLRYIVGDSVFAKLSEVLSSRVCVVGTYGSNGSEENGWQNNMMEFLCLLSMPDDLVEDRFSAIMVDDRRNAPR